jgi:hypothetical protein
MRKRGKKGIVPQGCRRHEVAFLRSHFLSSTEAVGRGERDRNRNCPQGFLLGVQDPDCLPKSKPAQEL